MVLTDSRRLPLIPRYLGNLSRVITVSLTGLSPSVAERSRLFSYRNDLSLDGRLAIRPENSRNSVDTTVATLRVVRFRLFPFRSPLLGKSLLFSLPWVTEMFHFSQLALFRLWIQRTVTGHYSRRVAPFGNLRVRLPPPTRSLSQVSYVLLRLLVPRHPPCALSNFSENLL